MARHRLTAVAVVGGLLVTSVSLATDTMQQAIARSLGLRTADTAAVPDVAPLPVLEQNDGQFDPQVDFVVRDDSATVFLADGALTYNTVADGEGHAVRMVIDGGDASVAPVVGETTPVVTNYFLGDDPADWVTDVVAAAEVTYPDVLDGVDVRYLGTPDGLQYDLVLAPGVDPAAVRLRFDGAETVAVGDAGELVVATSLAEPLSFSAPISYQDVDGERRVVESAYTVGPDGTVGFEVGEHEPDLPLVIDPTLQLSTFLGGTGTDYSDSVAVASNGDIVVLGRTTSTNYPTTVGAYDTTDQAGDEIAVSRLAAGGSSLSWSTYIGGTGNDDPNAIEVNASGQIVLTGYTTSTDFPTTAGAYDTTANGSTDVVVVTLASAGNSLVGSTYLGGSGADTGYELGLDTSSNVVVAGNTASNPFPTTLGAYDRTFGGSTDVFVAKLPAALTSLSWSTYLGGAGADTAIDVDVDTSNGVHVTGDAASGFPTTVGAYDTTHNGGTDAFYAALSSSGATLDYGTFLGGTGNDVGRAIEAASTTSIFLVGNSASAGFPTTAGAYDTSHNGSDDAVVMRLDRSQTGSAVLSWSTFFGGSGSEWAADLAIDSHGRPVVGLTAGSSGLATSGAPDTTLGGASDAMAVAFTASGAARVMATYHGGSSDETLYGLVLDSSDRIVISGDTSSTDLSTVAAYDSTHNGGTWDVFTARFSALPAPSVVQVNSTADGADASAGNGVCETSTAGECTLRAAIQEANASAAVDTVHFAIPTSASGYSAGRGVFTITPSSSLPSITAGVTIAGATQATNVGNTNAGTLGTSTSVGTGPDGVLGTGDEPTIDGVARPEVEIQLAGSQGFRIDASSVTISGLAVLGGNVDMWISSGTGAVIEDMVVGTRADSFSDPGPGVRSTGSAGVWISGGTNPTVRNNLIGYQSNRGVQVGGTVTGVTISGNEVRATAQATSVEGGGIELINHWVPGGSTTGASVTGNLVTDGVDDFAIEVATSASDSGLVVTDNTIGGKATVLVYGTQNADGGTLSHNVIHGSQGFAVQLADVSGWTISENSMTGSAWLGISLSNANDGLSHPTITAADSSAGTATVGYSVTAPAGTYAVEFFDNDAGHVNGYGEGETYRATATIVHAGGTASYTAQVDALAGDVLTATLTRDLGGGDLGSTSGFSPAFTVTQSPDVVVNSTGDTGDASVGDGDCDTGGTNSAGADACTLRAAIQEANAVAGIDRIEFAMPTGESGHASGVWTITPASSLPAISTSLTLDATTQSGWTATPVVAISGASLPSGPGISVTGDDVTVSGLAVRSIPGDGIAVSGARATIERNHLGTNAAGTAAAGNTRYGLLVTGPDAVIDSNLISGNGDNGVSLEPGAHRARLVDNKIGTTVSGNAALANNEEGVQLTDADDVVIGEPGHGNVIAGNRYAGINAWTTASTGVVVQANLIGVGANGTTALGNGSAVTEGGITFRGPSTGWLIGGDTAGEGNVIANNTGDGVQLWNGQGIANDIAVIGNSIHSNTGLAIDLGDDGVTVNDTGDGDGGANDGLNTPVIGAIEVVDGTATVDLTLDVPAGTYRVEFFDNATADASGYGEAQTYLGATTVVHPGGGAIVATASVAMDGGELVSATATEALGGGAYGATSEVSAGVAAVAPTLVVNSTGDASDTAPGDGGCSTGGTVAGHPACTLRAAIEEANAHASVNAIEFDIPASDSGHASGVWTIAPTTALPSITSAVTIDATTQPGSSVNTSDDVDDSVKTVVLDGVSAGAVNGLTLGGTGGSTVRGLVVTRFGVHGIVVSSTGNTVAGNWIGLGADGVSDRGNTGSGVFVTATGNTIGGAAPADRNVASGNSATGVYIYDTASNTVTGNLIGTDAAGTAAVANTYGVRLHLSSANTVGGTTPATRNVISGNTTAGMWLRSSSTQSNVIAGNRIGPAATGSGFVPNGVGIWVDDATSSNMIGGTTPAAANVIAGNTGAGVTMYGSAGVQPDDTSVLGNAIYGNGGIGIDLSGLTVAADGVSPNDAGDADGGANGRLNFPDLVSATEIQGAALVDLELDVPAGAYRVELFRNPGGVDASGFGEGQALVGAVAVDHPGGGAWATSVTVAAAAGDVLTATVTEDLGGGTYGATSELSAPITVGAGGGVVRDHGRRRSDLTAVGGADATPVAGGLTADAVDLGGDIERFVGPPTEITSGALTVSAWVRLDATGTDPRVLSRRTAGGSLLELLVDDATGVAVARVLVGGSVVEVSGGAVGTTTWHQLAATWDGSQVTLYVDGAEVDTAAASGALGSDLAAPLVLGNTETADRPFDGRIDAVRLAHVVRSAAWIETEYLNLTQPERFVTLGAEQRSTPGAWSVSPTAGRSGSGALAAPPALPGVEAWATARGIDEPGLVFESWWYVTDVATARIGAGTNTGATPTDQREVGLTDGTIDLATHAGGTRAVDAVSGAGLPNGTWVRVVIRTDETGRSSVSVGGTQVIAPTLHSGGASAGSAGVRAGRLDGSEWYVDDVRLRRLVSDEPTTALGPMHRN